MKRIIISLGTIMLLGVVVVGGTAAFFGDTEISAGNTFTAGAIDLEIDNDSYYNGEFNPGTSWDLKSLDGELFFNFLDLKPDDEGEDTISIHVGTNDAWACMDVTVTAFNDNGCTEPEFDDEELLYGVASSTCGNPGPDEGELQNEINFVWWADDGDNVLETDETELTFGQTSLSELAIHVPLADASGFGLFGTEPLSATTTYYIGKAWCYGTLTLDPVPSGQGVDPTVDPGIDCDGITVDNVTQTDSVEGTVSFFAIQSRHNDDFVCDNGGPLGCLEEADVMLVLDRSGSIVSAGATSTVVAAAKAFVDALAPTTTGIHVGLASFGSTASLDVHLTSDGEAVKTGIDGLLFGGGTFLEGGITIADLELDNPGDGHDRLDVSSPDVMVIITDGAATIGGTGEAQADAAKADGIEIFAVGVAISTTTAAFFEAEIVSVPGASHYFDAIDFAALEAVLGDLAMCELEV